MRSLAPGAYHAILSGCTCAIKQPHEGEMSDTPTSAVHAAQVTEYLAAGDLRRALNQADTEYSWWKRGRFEPFQDTHALVQEAVTATSCRLTHIRISLHEQQEQHLLVPHSNTDTLSAGESHWT